MTDRPDSPDGPGSADAVASDEAPEIATVRRLLADARHDGPMPDDVATRMDDVLAELAATPPAARAPSAYEDVVPIAAHRRRRVAGLLVAAAAVVVGAVVLGPHLPSSTSGSSAGSGAQAADSAHSDKAAGNAPTQTTPAPASPTQREFGATANAPRARLQDGRIVVRDRYFTADALHGRALLRRSTVDEQKLTAVRDCTDIPHTRAVVAATYHRAPAALVYRRPEGTSQVVDLYVCGNPEPVRSTTLIAP